MCGRTAEDGSASCWRRRFRLDLTPTPDQRELYVACLTGDDRWHTGLSAGDHPNGVDRLFAVPLDGSGRAHREFAEDYYETAVSLEAVEAVLARRPLIEELVRNLNTDLALADLAGDLDEIGVPEASPGQCGGRTVRRPDSAPAGQTLDGQTLAG